MGTSLMAPLLLPTKYLVPFLHLLKNENKCMFIWNPGTFDDEMDLGDLCQAAIFLWKVVYSSQNLIIDSLCVPLLCLIDDNSSLDIVASAISCEPFCSSNGCPSSIVFFLHAHSCISKDLFLWNLGTADKSIPFDMFYLHAFIPFVCVPFFSFLFGHV